MDIDRRYVPIKRSPDAMRRMRTLFKRIATEDAFFNVHSPRKMMTKFKSVANIPMIHAITSKNKHFYIM